MAKRLVRTLHNVFRPRHILQLIGDGLVWEFNVDGAEYVNEPRW